MSKERAPKGMFTVVWAIDVEGVDGDTGLAGPECAAREALAIVQDPGSIATVFRVTDDLGHTGVVDIGDDNEAIWLEEMR